MQVIFLTVDLMFSSRVLGAATSLGLTLKITPSADVCRRAQAPKRN